VLKGIVPDKAPRDLSIEMVLVGGKQRTAAELRVLARAAGLEVLSADRQASGYFLAECRPTDDDSTQVR
jgi:hypothetical protein